MTLKEMLSHARATKKKLAQYSGLAKSTIEYLEAKGAYWETMARATITCGYKLDKYEGIRKLSECKVTPISLGNWETPSIEKATINFPASGLSPKVYFEGVANRMSVSWPEEVLIRVATVGLRWPKALGTANTRVALSIFGGTGNA